MSAVLRNFGLQVGSIRLCLMIAQAAFAQSPPFDLLLRNARIVDGSGNQSTRGDVAIPGDTRAGSLRPCEAIADA